MLKILYFLFVSIFLVNAKHEEFIGHSLYEVKVHNLNQVDDLNAILENLNLDIWSHAVPGSDGFILVAKDLKETFENKLRSIGVEYKIDTANIKEKLDLEDQLLAEAYKTANVSELGRSSSRLSMNVIHRYAAVDQYLTDIARMFPNVARVVSAGRSREGRDIKYLRISSDNFQNTRKPVVFMQSLIHAREWITLPITLYAIQKLVVDVSEQDLVRDIDWIILPIANPDGYEFSHTNTRMWRKNRVNNAIVFCPGVDLNRNYDVNWGTASSSSPCTDTFHGAHPFSEPETQITRNIINSFRSRISLFLDIHSFGSMILYAYGNRTLPSNALTLNMIGVQMAQRIDAVKWPNNPNYRVGNIVDVIRYFASGGASDYAQTMIGQGFSYTYELPAYRNENGFNGFLVDPAFIPQAAFETWEGVKVAARYVARI
ncbi:unnamed protein product, partial [Brenthis ino]